MYAHTTHVHVRIRPGTHNTRRHTVNGLYLVINFLLSMSRLENTHVENRANEFAPHLVRSSSAKAIGTDTVNKKCAPMSVVTSI